MATFTHARQAIDALIAHRFPGLVATRPDTLLSGEEIPGGGLVIEAKQGGMQSLSQVNGVLERYGIPCRYETSGAGKSEAVLVIDVGAPRTDQGLNAMAADLVEEFPPQPGGSLVVKTALAKARHAIPTKADGTPADPQQAAAVIAEARKGLDDLAKQFGVKAMVDAQIRPKRGAGRATTSE